MQNLLPGPDWEQYGIVGVILAGVAVLLGAVAKFVRQVLPGKAAGSDSQDAAMDLREDLMENKIELLKALRKLEDDIIEKIDKVDDLRRENENALFEKIEAVNTRLARVEGRLEPAGD